MNKNEWLAEKVGFKVSHYQEGQTFGIYPVWRYPDGTFCGAKLPPFESSLDVLSKFVWPRMRDLLYQQGRNFSGVAYKYYRMSGDEKDVESWGVFDGLTIPFVEVFISDDENIKACFDACCEALGWKDN